MTGWVYERGKNVTLGGLDCHRRSLVMAGTFYDASPLVVAG